MDASESTKTHDGFPTAMTVRSLSTAICAAMLVLYAIYFARSLVVPIVTALFAYLTLRPIVRQTRRYGIPPSVSAAAIMVMIIGLCGMGTYLVIDPAREIVDEAPSNMAIVKKRLSFVLAKVEDISAATDEITEPAETNSPASDIAEKPVPVEVKQPAWTTNLTIVSGTGNLVSFLIIAGVLTYFLLATGDDVIKNIMRALPNLSARKKMIGLIESVQDGLGSYLAQVTAINIALGIAVGSAMWLLGMPSPVLWGVMATTFNFIPILGAICGALIIFLVALVNFEATYYAFSVGATFVTLTTLEGQFITPAILGRSMKMSPVLVFLSIVFWGWLWGLMGVFLSVPILIAIRMACDQYSRMTPLGAVLGGASAVDSEVEQSESERQLAWLPAPK